MTTPSLEIASNHVSVDGLRIHYRTAGHGGPIILVHGFPTSSYLWRHIIPALAPIRRVIAPDLLGFGESAKPRDARYTFEYQSQFFARFIDILGLDPVDLVVHDLGAPISLLWAVRNPHQVRTIAILNTILTPDYSWRDRLLLGLLRIPGLARLATLTRSALVQGTLKQMVYDRRRMTNELIAAYLAPYPSASDRRQLLRTFTDPMNAPGRLELNEISQQLPRLNVPIHLIVAEDDPFCHGYMQRLMAMLPQAPVTRIPRCGHLLPEDAPEQLQELLVNAISGSDCVCPAARLS